MLQPVRELEVYGNEALLREYTFVKWGFGNRLFPKADDNIDFNRRVSREQVFDIDSVNYYLIDEWDQIIETNFLIVLAFKALSAKHSETWAFYC